MEPKTMNYDNEIEKNVRGMAAALGLPEHLADNAVRVSKARTHRDWEGADETPLSDERDIELFLRGFSGKDLARWTGTPCEVSEIPAHAPLALQPWFVRAIEIERQYQAKERMRAAIAEVCEYGLFTNSPDSFFSTDRLVLKGPTWKFSRLYESKGGAQ